MANPQLLAKIASTQPNPTLDLPTALQRYLAGESMQVLAKEWQISPQASYKRIQRYVLSYSGSDQAYHELITQALVDRVAAADERLENAPDAVEIARAREIARFARMDLERRRPKLYGQKQEVEVDSSLTIIVSRAPQYIEAGPPIIEAESQRVGNTEE